MSTIHERNLKKVLSLTDTVGIAFGQIIGSGILILTGLAIGFTGRGAVLAFLISGFLTLLANLPLAQLSSAIPTTGASYRYSSRLLGPKYGMLWLIGLVTSKVTIALFALSFAQYLQGLFPSIPIQTGALGMLTIFYLINLVGVKVAAIAEKWLVAIKIVAIATLAIWGFPHVDFSSFLSVKALLPNGLGGMGQALGILAYAAAGGICVAELGGEMKNPGRDIPLTIVLSTIGATVFYVLIAIVAAGVLPIADVAGKPLTLVAKAILPSPMFYFFIVGGALFGLATTLNAVFSWITKGLIIGCQDGWLPNSWGAVNKRFGTPHYLLTFFYCLGVATILSGISLAEIARIGFSLLLMINLLPVFACALLPRKFPAQYAAAPFRMKPPVLYTVVCSSLIVMVGQIYYLLAGLPYTLLACVVGVVVAAIVYVNIMGGRERLKIVDDASFQLSGSVK
jgi:APA family basic amino acid/polyamine antiporter